MQNSSPKVFYRFRDGFDSHLIPCSVLCRIDMDLYEIRYEDPFLREIDGSHMNVTKIVNQVDLMLPGYQL